MPIRAGEKHTIRVIAFPAAEGQTKDTCPTFKFFAEQKARDADDFEDLLTLLTRTANHGVPQTDTRFKYLTGSEGIHEFKTSGGLRLFCFWDEGHLIVCTHGILKARQKTPPGEIARAERMKRDYFEAKKKGELTHVPPRKH